MKLICKGMVYLNDLGEEKMLFLYTDLSNFFGTFIYF
jgi:hypothetical protein